MPAIRIAENIYSVGVIDWNMRDFHGQPYRRGTSYNAYLIIDEKITLVDTVFGPFAGELIENIRQIVDPSKIDHIIVNHIETDHSGALPEVLALCPKAAVHGTARCRDGLRRMYSCDMDFHVVKTGDRLTLGKRTLSFIEAPMIHWPDSMFTYVVGDAILMPNDAFGEHFAAGKRFDDEVDACVLMQEAAKYYANILWPLSTIIAAKLADLEKMNLPLAMIAPSHGIIWRRDPGKIIEAYRAWSRNAVRPKVVVAYATMWGATETMARRIVDGIQDAGVEVRLMDVKKNDYTDIAAEMLDARGFLFGSSTHDNDMLPQMASFLETVKGSKAKNRLAGVFGSYGWGGGAVKEMEGMVAAAGIELAQPSLAVKFRPDAADQAGCYDFGRQFAQKIAG
jgi:flavorubredoxin